MSKVFDDNDSRLTWDNLIIACCISIIFFWAPAIALVVWLVA